MSGTSRAAVESMMRSLPMASSGGITGTEPVARMACLKRTTCGSSPPTRMLRESSKAPRPPMTATPFALATEASPRASLPTTRSAFHLRIGSSEMRASPKSTPNSLARSASPSTAATWRSALDGMQPSKRQAPPRRCPASITTVSRPSSAQRKAAEYPPGPPPSTATSTSVTRSPITMALPLREEGLGRFQAADDGLGEARAVRAVGHAVIEGEAQRKHGARHNLAAADHRLFPPPRHPENGHLRVVDDGNRPCAHKGADVRDGEAAPAQVVQGGLAVAHPLGERGQLAGQLHHGLLVHVANHRNDQAAFGGHRDAEMAVALENQLARPRIETRVELGTLAKRQRRRLEEEAREGEGDAVLLRRLEAPRHHGVEVGHVGLVEVRDVRDKG